MTVDNKVMELIRKLHRKAESAKNLGNAHEASAFAAKVAELLSRHKLTMTQVEFDALNREDPMGYEWTTAEGGKQKKARVAWQSLLADAVARAHFCRILIHHDQNKNNLISILGRASDREVAIYMIHVLTDFALQTSHREMLRARREQKRAGNYFGARGYRQAWLNSFVYEVRNRYAQMIDEREQEARSTGTSLIRLRQEQAAVDAYTERHSSGKPASLGAKKIGANELGRLDGAHAGRSVSLRANALNKSPAPESRRLGR